MVEKSTFSEHGHVAYQIKRSHKCSNIVANILPADPPPPLGWGQKVKNRLFQKPQTPLPQPLILGDGINIQLFQNMVMIKF